MEWKESYLDLVLVPPSLLLTILYHFWLWRKLRHNPNSTTIGINSGAHKTWVTTMLKENSRKHMLVVQTMRNSIMASTLMATTSILLSSGLAAILSTTYHKPLNGSVYGASGGTVVAVKYGVLLVFFLFAFLCYSLSIGFMNQVNVLINIPHEEEDDGVAEYVTWLLEKGFGLQMVGNRVFYAALPLLLWIFGPVFVFVCSLLMLPLLYSIDVVHIVRHPKKKIELTVNCVSCSDK